MARLDRDFKLLAVANVLYSTGFGMYSQLLFVYALQLGASRFTIGLLNALMWATIMAVNIPGAWAATRFRLKPFLVATWWLLVPTSLAYYFAPTWQWLIPGLILFGLGYSNMPVFKAYIFLKSDETSVGRSMAFVYGSYSLGLVAAPLLGGWIAESYGMKTVFLASTVAFVASSTVICFIRDVPHHPPKAEWRVHHLLRGTAFRGHVAFFLAGFLAVYVAQAFVNPYLSQVHQQSYLALGVYASLVALGGVLVLQLVGRLTDRWGPRAGAGSALVLLLLGCLLLVAGARPAVWTVAMLCLGAFDTFRLMPSMFLPGSFGDAPLQWGYAVFDTAMGVPMVLGAVLGGLLYRASYALPFEVAIGISACLILLVLLRGPLAERAPR